ncbi:MAG: hypothetical protein K0S49_2480 [Microbacterium sp.]|jgi:hypothetical protein|nr:hypothetical protein [Microbacterium sp.]
MGTLWQVIDLRRSEASVSGCSPLEGGGTFRPSRSSLWGEQVISYAAPGIVAKRRDIPGVSRPYIPVIPREDAVQRRPAARCTHSPAM